jgi:hypothetical protein
LLPCDDSASLKKNNLPNPKGFGAVEYQTFHYLNCKFK